MPTRPEGAPGWTHTADISKYGGHPEKQNYAGRQGIDPLTDVNASQFARLTADLVAATLTAPLAIATIGCDDYTPGPPLFGARRKPSDPTKTEPYGGACQAAWGVRAAPYNGDGAPSHYPSASRNGTGDVTITFPATPRDGYGVAADIEIVQAFAQLYGGSDPKATAVAEILSANSVRVRCFDGLGAPLANACFSLVVS